jgi:glycosyltransferase involved in cell wall biosynthesis
VLVTCSAPLGVGGLGRHLSEIVDALARAGQPHDHIDEAPGSSYGLRAGARVAALSAVAPAFRLSPAWRLWRASVSFDLDAARRLSACDQLVGFNGTSLAQFRAAAGAGIGAVSLVSATAHLRVLVRRHALARASHPLERSWATRVLARNLAEYQCAERVFVSSQYVWDSFVAEGFDESRLVRFPLTPAPAYRPQASAPASGAFVVAYVGGLTVDKGAPLLVDAVRRLPHSDLRLRLVGGWKTRGMRGFMEDAMARDKRIEVAAGAPLQVLREARLYVHPAYSDGFGYAPAEALACGVPVLVSEDTGMRDLVDEGRTGMVLPTGDAQALAEAIDAAYRGEVLGSRG